MQRGDILGSPIQRFSVLRLLLAVNETGAPYNQFSLALADQQDIAVCTYFRPKIAVHERIKLFSGDDTLPGFFRALRAALAANRYDVIHAHTPHVGFLLIITSLFMNPELLRSTVYTIHSSYPHYKLGHRFMLIWVFAFFHRIISCSYASFESFPPFFKWLGGDRFQVVQNGVDIDRVDRIVGRNHRRAEQNGFTILAIGRLIELKNPGIVLSAFEASQDQKGQLIFIGEGHLRSPLIAQIGKAGLEQHVKITGLIPREQVYQYMATADLFVSASSIEGLPVAVLEAMACRCPVILSDIPSHREIAEGVDFIPLIWPDDVAGFAREMQKFQAMSSSERVEIGERCRKLVEERFNLAAMHRGYAQIYSQVIKGRDDSGGLYQERDERTAEG